MRKLSKTTQPCADMKQRTVSAENAPVCCKCCKLCNARVASVSIFSGACKTASRGRCAFKVRRGQLKLSIWICKRGRRLTAVCLGVDWQLWQPVRWPWALERRCRGVQPPTDLHIVVLVKLERVFAILLKKRGTDSWGCSSQPHGWFLVACTLSSTHYGGAEVAQDSAAVSTYSASRQSISLTCHVRPCPGLPFVSARQERCS